MDDFFESALSTLREAIKSKYDDNIAQAAVDLDVAYITLYSWITGKRRPSLTKLAPVLSKLGAKITIPAPEKKSVQLINAYIAEAENALPPPHEEDYLAAPIVGEVGAGPGIAPENDLKGWFMVRRSLAQGRALHNLLAVEISSHSISMQPTLRPGDIVLVDKDDLEIAPSGSLMLVMDPVDSGAMIKRVGVRELKGDAQITFYSDNWQQFSPVTYSLMEDFGGEWRNAIGGKVIWAWTNMSGK